MRLIITDNNRNQESDSILLLWSDVYEDPDERVISLPAYLEKNSDLFRKKYIRWVTDIYILNNKDIHNIRSKLSYWWFTTINEKCNYLKSPQIYLSLKLYAIQDIAVKKFATEIILDQVNIPKPVALIIRNWCNKNKIIFKIINNYKYLEYKEKVSLVRRCYRLMPVSMQGISWLVATLMRRILYYPPAICSDSIVNDIMIIGYLNDNNIINNDINSIYWGPLESKLQEWGVSVNWLYLYSGDGNLKKVRNLRKAISENNKLHLSNRYILLDSYIDIGVVIKTIYDWFMLMGSTALSRKIINIDNSDPDIWPLFKSEYMNDIYGQPALRNILYLNLFEKFFSSIKKQKIGVFIKENQAWEMGLIYSWKINDHKKIIGSPNSTIRYWDLRFSDVNIYDTFFKESNPKNWIDEIALNGEHAKKEYIEHGNIDHKLKIVEALRYLKLNIPKKHRRIGKICRILILGDYSHTVTTMQFDFMSRWLHNYGDENIIIYYRKHPSNNNNYSKYMMFDDELNGGIDEVLDEVDLVFSGPNTSAVVDAAILGVPIATLLDGNNFNLSPLRGCKNINFIESPEDFQRVILDITRNKFSYIENFFTLDKSIPGWKKLLLQEN